MSALASLPADAGVRASRGAGVEAGLRPSRGAGLEAFRQTGKLHDAHDEAARALRHRLRHGVWSGSDGESPLENCLCALILAIEPNIEVARIVEALPNASERLDLVDVFNAMINIGYRARSGVIRPSEIDARLLPCLFLPSLDETSDPPEALVIHAVRQTPEGDSLLVFDGANGTTAALPLDDPTAGRLGRAVFFLPTKREEEDGSPTMRAQTGRTWFSAILRQFKGTFWQLFSVGMTLSFVGLGTPLFIMLVYDRVIAPRATEPLAYLAVGVALAIGMEWLLRLLRAHSLSWLAARLDYIVGTSIFERLIQLPPAYIERASPAAQIARVKTFESVRDFFSGPVFMSVIELPTILVSFAAIAWFGGPLAVVPLVMALIYGLLFWLVRLKVMVAIRQAAKATSATQQFTLETFQKIDAIRGTGLADTWGRKYADLSGRENLAQFRLYLLSVVGESAAHALTLVAAVATLAFGVELIWEDRITTGTLVASMILTWRVLAPFHGLCTMIPRFEQLRNSILQINDLMDVAIEAESDEIATRLPKIDGRVNFANVGLRYSREAGPVFLGLNAEIRQGEIVAITGANGSGKSSLLKMVLGLYPTISGSVRIDGFDIRQLVQRDLRRQIAYVPQSPDLVTGSIAETLRFSKPLASDRELWEQLDEVGAAAEVAALPQGLDTPVTSPQMTLLSSGTLYRLAFARALLLNSSLLLIDEHPNAILNAGLGELIRRILQSSRGHRTVIFVSHRVDHLRLADRAIALRRGEVPVCGPVDRIMAMAS